jgi:hypothetical protein
MECDIGKKVINFMIIDYMEKLKDICDDSLINEQLLGWTNELIIIDNAKIFNSLIENRNKESCIDDICYSPFSDTFSIYISSSLKARKIFHTLSNAFQDIQVDIEEGNDFSIIEIQYNKDKFYQEHIENNVEDIISLKSSENINMDNFF